MSIDKDKVKSQRDTGKLAEIDQVEERVEAEMELIKARAKERVAHGLQDKELEAKAKKQGETAQTKLKDEKPK